MFRLLPTTKCKRQQIAILIISFFAYVAGIRNENNNMLLLQQQEQQQLLQHQQQHMTIENSNYKRSLTSNQNPVTDIKQQTNLNFRPSPIIDFTTADATVPQKYKPTYIDGTYSNINTATFNTNTQQQQQEQVQMQQNDNRRYTTTTTYGNTAEKQFSFPNEQQQQQEESLQQQQQIPQQLTDRPIYIYRDPYTNENYHYTPTEPIIQDTTSSTPPYNHNNYNGNSYKQQQQHEQHPYHRPSNNNQQEYLVQSSMIVGTHQQQQQQQQPLLLQQHPYMSLSDDKDVYLKRPGLVYDEKISYNHPNSIIDKKSGEAAASAQTVKANKISYDSHDYPPPSYFQQQTSNFLPTPVPDVAQPKPTPRPVPRPTPPRQEYRPPSTTPSQLFGHQQQQQYLQTSQSSLPNYANNIDNYLSNKQQSDYYRTETPPHIYTPHKQQYETIPPFGVQQQQQQYESRPPPSYQQHYETRPPPYQQLQQYESKPPPYYQQQQQYESRPPSYNQVVSQQSYYPQYETPNQQQQTSLQRPPGRPSYNNYYDYQIGEVPPQKQTSSPSSQNFNYPYPRPPATQYPPQGAYRPPPPIQQQQSGLATLAQYAPQFTQLLLGGGGGGTSSNTNSPLGSLIGALTGATTSQQQPSYNPSSPSSSSYNRRPVNSQLIRALENIARNDDLQCVPKVLCQMIAAQTQRGQLPTFITSPTITNFLAGFPAASPALIYGRAALLGLSGGEKSCHQTYVKCPKNEYEIIYYLNNHRGGFFKFFSEPEEQQNNEHNDSTQQGGASSLFSILAALTGSPAQQVITTTPRPTPKPQAPSADITSGIGNFFTQLLSDYMGGATVEYQRRIKRRARRSVNDKIIFEDNRDKIKFEDDDDNNEEENVGEVDEDFHDEEDNMDTQQGIEFRDEDEEDKDVDLDDTQSRILHKPGFRGKQVKFFPEIQEALSENEKDQHLKAVIQKFNDFNKGRKLKFPTATDERQYLDVTEDSVRQGKELSDLPYEQEQNYGYQYTNYIEESYDPLHRDTKKVKFQDDNQEQSLYSDYAATSENVKTKLVFPERLGKILNNPYYASTYSYNDIPATQEQDDKFVLPNTQRPSRYTEFPHSSSANVYNTHINSINSQNSFTSSSSVNNNYYGSPSDSHKNSDNSHFLPTPPPDTDYSSSNSIYSSSNNNYSSNQGNYNSQYHSNYHKPQRYPANTNKYQSNRYTDRYHSSLYTTRRPYTTTTKKSDDKNIYITNSRGVTEYYITPDGRKVYL